MMRRSLVLILLVVIFGAAGAAAQVATVPLRPAPSQLLWERPSSVAAHRLREPLGGLLGPGDEDHRYTGFFVGAGLGLVLTTVNFMMCDQDDGGCDGSRVLPIGVLMSGVLGLSGAVIGGFLPR